MTMKIQIGTLGISTENPMHPEWALVKEIYPEESPSYLGVETSTGDNKSLGPNQFRAVIEQTYCKTLPEAMEAWREEMTAFVIWHKKLDSFF